MEIEILVFLVYFVNFFWVRVLEYIKSKRVIIFIFIVIVLFIFNVNVFFGRGFIFDVIIFIKVAVRMFVKKIRKDKNIGRLYFELSFIFFVFNFVIKIIGIFMIKI